MICKEKKMFFLGYFKDINTENQVFLNSNSVKDFMCCQNGNMPLAIIGQKCRININYLQLFVFRRDEKK